jgi:AcrR family transcriptional regulator
MHSQRDPEVEPLQEMNLPRAIRFAWGLGEATNRGPKPRQSTDQILAAAIELADDVGLDKLSMAAIAKPLNIAATALYRYVDSKETLIELMVDLAVGVPPAKGPSRDWSDNVRTWARALLDAYARHPWLSDVAIAGMPRTPNSLAWIESLLESLEDAPVLEDERLSATLLLQGIVRNHAAMMRSIVASPGPDESFLAVLPALSSGAHPRLIAELQADRNTLKDEFDFAVNTMINGLAAPPL